MRELFSEANKTGYSFDSFIDIGSGKGKACFYAHINQSFKNILGVEFSKSLLDITNENKSKINTSIITFLNIDTIEFDLPKTNNLIFMFNPFDDVVLEKFISNNLHHFKKHQSVIAYVNDIQRSTLTRLGFETIFRNQSRKISLYQHSLINQ